jgi:hypothetical protein
MSQTSEALRAISPGDFERLASSVLRRAAPDYQGLIQTGVNTDGQTVKSPIDGICSTPGSHPPYFVIFHYTTTQRSSLKTKWLHKHTQSGKGSKTPDGDIVKAIRWTEKQREEEPSTRVRLVLACSEGPDSQLVAEAKQICAKYHIELDIWELSRLEDFLENNTDGQWLRKKYLNVEQERLSIELLRELTQQSCFSYAQYENLEEQEAWIDRGLDEHLHERVWERGAAVILLVAGSGQGKTTASYKLLKRHIDSGGIGLWIEPRFLDGATTLDTAIDEALRSRYPALEVGSGMRARELAALEGGLLLLLDDINRFSRPTELVQRVIALSGEGCRILCPVWPQVLDQLLERFRDRLEPLCLYAEGFSSEEGVFALERRAKVVGRSLTGVEAEELAGELAYDPLLISLWCGSQGDDVKATDVDTAIADSVIHGFIQRRLRSLEVSSIGMATAAECWETLLDLARRMLLNRREVPSWREVESWFEGKPRRLDMLQRLVGDRVICRLGDDVVSAPLLFRHDRVRDHILTRDLRDWMVEGSVPDHLLSEPHYAEILGQALAAATLAPSYADRIAERNPLALACALRHFREPTNSFQEALVASLQRWLRAKVESDRCIPSLRSAVLWEFQRTDSPLVLALAKNFCELSMLRLGSQLRNGDAEAGALLCSLLGLNFHLQWVGYLARHATLRLGKAFLESLANLVERSDISDDLRIGALILSGWVAEPTLLKAISKYWMEKSRIDNPSILAILIWVVSRCGEGEPPSMLGAMIGNWAVLSNETREDSDDSSRIRVAVILQRAFMAAPPHESIVDYLILHGQKPELAAPIAGTLSYMNHPSAVTFVVEHAAQADREAYEAGEPRSYSALYTLPWNSRLTSSAQRLSVACADRLRELWETAGVDRFLQRRALTLWLTQADRGDLPNLRAIEADSPLYEEAFRARIRIGDTSVVAGLIEKLQERGWEDYLWSDCERIWCSELKAAFDIYLGEKAYIPDGWDFLGTFRASVVLLGRIPEDDAEEIILRHWPRLNRSYAYFQAALRIATPRCLAAVAETMRADPKPRRLQHVCGGIGIEVSGQDEYVSLRHLNALQPYLGLLEEDTLKGLWRFCNRRRLFSWRRKNLDSILSDKLRQELGLEDNALISQLELLARGNEADGESWLEDFERRGDPVDRAKDLLARWLRERRSLEALRITGHCLALIGTRKDLVLLEAADLSSEDPQVAEVIKDTRFAIYRRTLD